MAAGHGTLRANPAETGRRPPACRERIGLGSVEFSVGSIWISPAEEIGRNPDPRIRAPFDVHGDAQGGPVPGHRLLGLANLAQVTRAQGEGRCVVAAAGVKH